MKDEEKSQQHQATLAVAIEEKLEGKTFEGSIDSNDCPKRIRAAEALPSMLPCCQQACEFARTVVLVFYGAIPTFGIWG